ncbi:MAG: EAL domain-containing protein [Desulfuromonadales bacterium]|nr:EAL domain-containing protein [Desulfuromonadales bacterium]
MNLIITLTFSSIMASVAVYFFRNKYEKTSHQLQKEIEEHRKTADERSKDQENLEKMVQKRTSDLIKVNVKLHEEIAERVKVMDALQASEDRLKDLVETISDWVWQTDENHVFTYSSFKVNEILGYEPSEIIGKTPFDLMPEEEACGIREIIHNFATFRMPFSFIENTNLHKAGHQITLETSGAPILDKRGDLCGYRGVSRDISGRKLAEEALRESESTLRGFFNANAIQMSVIELRDDDFIYCMPNKRIAELYGLSLEEMNGKSARELGCSDQLRRHLIEIFRYCLHNREPISFEYEFPCHNLTYWYQCSISPIYDSISSCHRFSFAAVDVTERKQAEQDIQQLAYFDSLTGLPNRTLLYDRLNQILEQAKREGKKVGVIFLDIDSFKWINDTLGHAGGDKLLKAVAERLKKRLRASDTFARLGGDEFVIVLSAVQHEQDVSHATQDIMDALSLPFELGGQELFITASIGIAIAPLDGEDVGNLLKNADTAMYAAKDAGKNTYKFFSQDMNQRAVERMSLESNLRRALEREEFSLSYQPQIDTRNGCIVGMEALLRWNHFEMGQVSPGKFIPVAEETGLIVPIGEWVLRTACAQAKSWIDAGYSFIRVAVNISGVQFKQGNLTVLVRQVLEETGLSPVNLELELTESVLMENAASAATMLRELKSLGVHLAIDDFGTGYSSLTYLKNFPIDRLKIDQLFIRDITTNPDDASISEAIIALAHSLKMDVIAEGVETREQMDFLRLLNCHEMQGYFFSCPVSKEKIYQLLKDGLFVENNAQFPLCLPTQTLADASLSTQW